MNILLVYPQYPDSFWSFKHAMRFISKKASVPPLGLITIAAMLPKAWHKKVVDMNITTLKTGDVVWADYVFISAMSIQKESVNEVIRECLKYKTKMVGGGPLFTQDYDNYPQIDHFILNEAEITLPPFLRDLASGNSPERIYRTDDFADLSDTPIPDYSLLSRKDYVVMNVQVTRGCPFSCDFCEITALLGHKVRMKKPSQILAELESLYYLNWRGPVLIVDDNFIGNKHEVKENLLPAMMEWMKNHRFPFTFETQTSINLADDDELLSMMVATGFTSTFIGIETPDEISLQVCNKSQNKNRDLLQCVKKIQKAGMSVSGGFIVGFDTDTSSVFQKQLDFIQQSGIVSAMVGILHAPKNTTLYKRMVGEDRIIKDSSGNNTDASINFIPKMNPKELLDGYNGLIRNIYSIKPYYKRVRQFLQTYQQLYAIKRRARFSLFKSLFKTVYIIGIANKGRGEFWKLMLWTLFRKPLLIKEAIQFAVYGYHFRIVYGLRK
ncbi:MAG: B12-binding domain-containing radical SAM protein [Bacteroidia bacterium]|nr:B12-binding domain-containing radical SAM protein [Bacteroidia bacterium]